MSSAETIRDLVDALTGQLERQTKIIERQTNINAANGELLNQIWQTVQKERGAPPWLVRILIIAILALSGVNVANMVGLI